MPKVFTEEQLLEIKRHLSVIQDCVSMGGLAPYQTSVINRRLNQALDVLSKGEVSLPPIAKDNREVLNALDDIRGTLDLFDEGYQYDETFGKDISENLDIIEKYITQ